MHPSIMFILFKQQEQLLKLLMEQKFIWVIMGGLYRPWHLPSLDPNNLSSNPSSDQLVMLLMEQLIEQWWIQLLTQQK